MGFGYSQETINKIIRLDPGRNTEFPVKVAIINPSDKEPYYQISFRLDIYSGLEMAQVRIMVLGLTESWLNRDKYSCFASVNSHAITLEFHYDKSRKFQDWLLNMVLEFESIKDANGNQIFKCA